MADKEKWIVTYGTIIEGEILEYASICDYIQDTLLEELRKCFPDVEAVDDARDGETYSIRFSMSSVPQPPKIIKIRGNKAKYELERLEIGPEKEIYPDELRYLLDEYNQILKKNLVPFDQLSLYFLFQAINSLEERIFEGTVLLCRSVIENSLYLACVYRKNVSDSGDVVLELILPESFIDKKKNRERAKIYWSDIEKVIKDLSIIDKAKLDGIHDKVMKKGNFAAHIAQRQMDEYKTWSKKYKSKIDDILKKQQQGQKINPASFPPGYKIRTSSTEATSAIESTIKFLIELTEGYANAS